MKYSKRVRDEAALICAIAASTPEVAECYSTIANRLDIKYSESKYESKSERLAFEAWKVTQYADHPDAEAEALIRTGWSP